MRRILLLASIAVAALARAEAPSDAVNAPEPRAPAAAPTPRPAGDQAPFELSGETITLEVPHAFARASARERVGFLLDYWHTRFGVQAEWHGDSVFLTGRVFGMAIKARFDVSDAAVTGVAADPGWFWRNKAQSYVTKKLKKYLHPDYADP